LGDDKVTVASALPRLTRYLAGLPNGFDSHPQCRTSAARLSVLLELARPDAELATLLPVPVGRLLAARPSERAWVPEVPAVALFLAVADRLGHSDEEFVELNRTLIRRLLRHQPIRVLMTLANPELLIAGAALRWSTLHQGTRLLAELDGPKRVRVELRYPVGCYPRLMLRCFVTAFETALELSNAVEGRAELVEVGAERALFRASWR
jgi:hypothetical protein